MDIAFQAMFGGILTYVVVLEAMLKDEDMLRSWIRRAANGLKAEPAKANKRKA